MTRPLLRAAGYVVLVSVVVSAVFVLGGAPRG